VRGSQAVTLLTRWIVLRARMAYSAPLAALLIVAALAGADAFLVTGCSFRRSLPVRSADARPVGRILLRAQAAGGEGRLFGLLDDEGEGKIAASELAKAMIAAGLKENAVRDATQGDTLLSEQEMGERVTKVGEMLGMTPEIVVMVMEQSLQARKNTAMQMQEQLTQKAAPKVCRTRAFQADDAGYRWPLLFAADGADGGRHPPTSSSRSSWASLSESTRLSSRMSGFGASRLAATSAGCGALTKRLPQPVL